MGARGNRGLIAGLASLAGSTGRIRVANEDRALLALKQKLADLEERRTKADLDEIERKNKLSALLSERLVGLPGMSETRTRPFMRGALQSEQVPTAEAKFLSALIEASPPGEQAYLYGKLFPEKERAKPGIRETLTSELGREPTDVELTRKLGIEPPERAPSVREGRDEKIADFRALMGRDPTEAEILEMGFGIEPRKAATAEAAGFDIQEVRNQVYLVVDRVFRDDKASAAAIRKEIDAGHSPFINSLVLKAKNPTEGNLRDLTNVLINLSKIKSKSQLLSSFGLASKQSFPIVGKTMPDVVAP